MKKLLLLLFLLIVFVPIDSHYVSINDPESELIQVEIRGNVNNEGIFELKRGTTIGEALNMAGLKENSSIDAINQTQILHNQDVITITEMDERLIHINTASLEELMTLPGIGEKTALKIIEYRSQHLFQSIEELMKVSGIGEKKFQALSGKIGL